VFERFTSDARQAVVLAQEEARRMGHDHIGCEHLLLGLLATGSGPAADALSAFGLQAPRLRGLVAGEAGLGSDPLDADALASLGIDLDAVRRATEASFGPGALERGKPGRPGSPLAGHIPFTPRAKKSLQLALRAAAKLRHSSITSGHVLLGILDPGNNAALLILAKAGVSPGALREDVTRRLTAAA
jgi:ATP-dependent Clp protease ATP-binding subunit ClpA